MVKEWTFDPGEILRSPRKVRGKFHTPMVDKDKEYIEGKAVRNAVPDFMHLPILHDFHKERTVGIVTRVVELPDGSFDFEGLIKATDDCNDIWELITRGKYDQVSLYGKRVCGSDSCKVRPEQRSNPCVTTAVRLDSISVCDENARNVGTSLEVAKSGRVVFTATEEIIKATTTSSPMSHEVTDYPKKKKGVDMDEVKAEQRIPPEKPPKKDAGIREARPGDKKSTAMKSEEPEESAEPVEEPMEEPTEEPMEDSIEDKLSKLEQMIEQLIQKDEEDKATKQEGEPIELPPEAEREYGDPVPNETREDVEVDPDPLPESAGESYAPDEIDAMAAKIHLSQKVAEKKANLSGEEEKARDLGFYKQTGMRPQRLGVNASPEEVEHTLNLYKQGKDEYLRNQEAEKQKVGQLKQDFVSPPEKRPTADAPTIDAKAKKDPGRVIPDWKKEQQQKKKEWLKETGPKPRKVAPENAPPVTNTVPDKPGIKSDGKGASVGQPHHTKEGKPWESTKPAAPQVDTPTVSHFSDQGAEKRREGYLKEKPATSRFDEAAHKDNPQSRPPGDWTGREGSNEGALSPAQLAANKQKDYKKKGLPPAGGSSKPSRTTAFGSKRGEYGHVEGETRTGGEDNKWHPEEQPEKAGDDVEARIDRLTELVARLVQSDTAVHQEMEQPRCGACEQKADDISKGTENMKDEDVDVLVKAKVDAQVAEITKAYQVQFDELKKANDDLKARLEKVENETITKSGVVAILREGDPEVGEAFLSNAGAIAAASKKAKAQG